MLGFDVAGPYGYSIIFRKSQLRIPFHVVIARIPDEDILAIERGDQRVFQAGEDGSVSTDFAGQGVDADRRFHELFDEFVVTVNGQAVKEKDLLHNVPAQVKRAIIENCYCNVSAETIVPETVDWLKFLQEPAVDNKVVLAHTVNDADLKLIHWFRDPTEADALVYRRVTSQVRFLPGRRRSQYQILERFEAYAQLYKTLASRVEGYFANDAALDCSVDGWTKTIPYLHQKVAVQALFNTSVQEQPLGEV